MHKPGHDPRPSIASAFVEETRCDGFDEHRPVGSGHWFAGMVEACCGATNFELASRTAYLDGSAPGGALLDVGQVAVMTLCVVAHFSLTSNSLPYRSFPAHSLSPRC